ncbi:MAG: hypothetical protein IPK19_17355 [Chloroflexi bacterium]|nr:hypothetical protein [Chloroflexota bacterium]
MGDLRAELLDWLERTEDHDFALPVSDTYREHDRVRLQELLQRRAAWKWPLESADAPRL